jgi:hypothetical protein
MQVQAINRWAGRAALVFALIALATVLAGYINTPHPHPTDEGTGAHIFQLAVVALLPTLLLFVATADWTHPLRGFRPLVLPVAILILAFVALYCLEHYR